MNTAGPILLVEDDESIREFIEMALTDEGFTVETASDGVAGLAAAARVKPRLILLDMRMRGLDGWGFSRAYRQSPGPHAPVVVLTAARDAGASAAEIEADAFLAKPFDLDDLLTLVRRFLGPEPADR
jgi:DNA-binding response OmpR family regulator